MLAEDQRFDRYVIEKLIGQGGMGHVYRAFDSRLDRHVALKVVQLADGELHKPELHARLLREARAAAKLDHPNAVVIYDVGEEGGTPFIAMELVNGRTLRELGVGSPLAESVSWLTDAARALEHAHQRGLVHRDVKPENVMVREDGRVKVLDFGIARRLVAPVDPTGPTVSPALPTLTKEGTLVGTTSFMSPEQIRGTDLDGRSDQFSWGVTAYEVLTGRALWKGDDPLAVAAAVLTDEPPALSEVPEPIAAVVLRCLQKKPGDRFASMQDVIAALETAQVGAVPAAPKPSDAATPDADLSGYSTREVSQILRRAIDLEQVKKNGLSRDELVEIAGEVGVPRDVLLDAIQELDAASAPPAPAASAPSPAPDPRSVQRLKRHAATFACISLFLMLLDLSTSGGSWFWWPVMGLGIFLALHAVRVSFPVDPKPKRARRSASKRSRKSVERGVQALTTASRRRLRADGPRLRVNTEPTGADEEAAEEIQAKVARRVANPERD